MNNFMLSPWVMPDEDARDDSPTDGPTAVAAKPPIVNPTKQGANPPNVSQHAQN